MNVVTDVTVGLFDPFDKEGLVLAVTYKNECKKAFVFCSICYVQEKLKTAQCTHIKEFIGKEIVIKENKWYIRK